jgi:hypothetical protein
VLSLHGQRHHHYHWYPAVSSLRTLPPEFFSSRSHAPIRPGRHTRGAVDARMHARTTTKTDVDRWTAARVMEGRITGWHDRDARLVAGSARQPMIESSPAVPSVVDPWIIIACGCYNLLISDLIRNQCPIGWDGRTREVVMFRGEKWCLPDGLISLGLGWY